MRFLPIAAILLCYSFTSVAQPKKFFYGTLSGAATFEGYFWFDNVLNTMGQRIWFKTNPNIKKKQTLYTHSFETFDGDEIFMRKFKLVVGLTSWEVMMPRVVTGKLELYNAEFRGYYAFSASDYYFIYDGKQKIRLIRRKFKEQMTQLLSDDADIIRRIENGEVKYDDMPTIIYNYNQRHGDDAEVELIN
jgi:hypothetical protein